MADGLAPIMGGDTRACATIPGADPIGGALMPQPRIAVVTPYYREPVEVLAQCHRSVVAQDVAADHFMIADGHPLDIVDGWDVSHIKLPRSHGDNGNTPRGLASVLAGSEGYDFVTYLDADNWYHAGHLSSLLQLWEQRRAPACTSFRTFHDAAGDDLGISEADEDALQHVDTSCLLLHRSAFDCLSLWLDMPKILSPIGDRVFLAGLLHRKVAIASTQLRSVAFRSQYAIHYAAANRPTPDGAKTAEMNAAALSYLATAEGISQCVDAIGFWPLSYMRA
jgi:glycosyltransferase involved in cell wall biosynthesis